MSLLKKTFLISSLALLASCYNPKTHGNFVSDQKDVWLDGYAVRMNEHESADKGLVFCRANVKENGTAKPVCFHPEFKEMEE